ncbi:MAG: hypothetical protein ABJK59_06230 [Erythrobacter sp.]|uniref:hypothetical protein n=1 Tax=Erythrobacter sp. TaxID=1042 RepID=UPI003299B832
MNNSNPTQPQLLQQRPLRLKWMRSASILAAASAMIAGGMPVYAQAGPGVAAPNAASMASRLPQGASELRVPTPTQLRSPSQPPVRIINAPRADVPTVNVPTVDTRALPMANDASNVPFFRQNAVAPLAPALVSTPTPPTPQAASSGNGASVNATAAFDDTQIRFTPSVAGDTVEILGTSAIVDWTTFVAGNGGPVTFLDAGQNLLFTSAENDFTVLNRITTPGVDAAVRIDGNVTSTTNGSAVVGGNVWFSSAGGLILGPTASFNIGSLLLTSSQVDPSDVVAGPSSIDLLGVADPGSAIEIQNGATINALNNNSYVAMVAPRIVQNGTVNVNGSVAYVAAEEATLTIQNNLFDISVLVGSEDGNGIVHGGTTTGPSSVAVTDEQAIYFVAVPKNDALTMLLSGDIGYAAAGSADVVNGNVILTTGDRVERQDTTTVIGGAQVQISSNTVDTTVDGGPAGSIELSSLSLNSDTQVFAEDTVSLTASSTFVDGDRDITVGTAVNEVTLEVVGGSAVDISVSEVALIDVSGSLAVRAGDGAGNGGDITVDVDFDDTFSSPDGGTLTVGGNLTLDASGRGFDDTGNTRNNGGNGIGADGFGGDVSVTVGQFAGINVGGSVVLDSSANGGRGDVRQGSAVAGNASFAVNEGFVDIGGTLTINAGAREAGTAVLVGQALEGGDATAGNVNFTLNGGGVDAGAIDISASATASSGSDNTIAQSNDASAGAVSFDITGGAHFFGSIDIRASAEAVASFDGSAPDSFIGDAGRGQVGINIGNADTLVDVGGSFDIDASATGSVSAPVGDTVALTIRDSGFGSVSGLTVGGLLGINANARTGARGTVTEAGSVSITADNGTLIADSVFITSDAFVSFSAATALNGTDFQGGRVNMTATNGGSIFISEFSEISANGIGRIIENAPAPGIGQGGSIIVLADNSVINFGDSLFLNANGVANTGVNTSGGTGAGVGGTVNITVQGGNGVLGFADLFAGTDGTFAFDGETLDNFFVGSGSSGTGGLTQFNVLGGSLDALDITVSSDGEGGPGGVNPGGAVNVVNGLQDTGDGGGGVGGEVVFNLDGGNATVVNLDVTSNGSGGFGASGDIFDDTNGGNGGNSTGGSATFNAVSGNLTVTDTLTVEATGNTEFGGINIGGDGGNARGSIAGEGGDSIGGSAVFDLVGTATVNATNVIVSTQAFGGDGGESRADTSGNPDQGGGDGGNAIGGTALFNDVSGNLTFDSLVVDASGRGGLGGESSGGFSGNAAQGEGGQGGSGTGGDALVSLNQDDAVAKTYSVLALGIGATGGEGAFAGAGGQGVGGRAELVVNDVAVVFDVLTIDASASGGLAADVTGDQVADGADGGDAEGGEALLLVSGSNADFQADSTISIIAGATGAQGGLGSVSLDDINRSGNGGRGGDAIGGSATVAVEDDAMVTIDTVDFIVNSDSVGGAGGNGQAHLFGGTPGDGGVGGDATGGVISIAAANGGEVTVVNASGPVELSSSGIGGSGGTGGNIDSGTGVGLGGAGGDGTGGSPRLSAVGGTINIGDLTLFAAGLGGNGGESGVALSNPLDTVARQGGNGSGGTPRIEAIEGSPGIINLGNVTIVASGSSGLGIQPSFGFGGQVTISDTSIDPAGLITFDNLTIDASGTNGTNAGLISISSNSGPITVAGRLDLDVFGDIEIAMAGDGQLVVNPSAGALNTTTFDASGDITIDHQNPSAGVNTIDAGTNFIATSTGGAFDASDLGDIVAGTNVSITAADIAYNSITTPREVNLTATAGSITGSSDGTISASDVLDAIDLIAVQNVTFGTLISNAGNIDIDAGAGVTGVRVDAAQFVNIDAGGTVTIDEIDSTRSAIGIVTVNAGAIDIGQVDAGFITTLTSMIGDLSVDGLNTPATADLTSAGAIDLGTGTVGEFTADAVGDVTIGSITTTGSAGDLRIAAGGTASFDSLDSNRLINIDATDIVGGDAAADGSIALEAGSIDVGDVSTQGSASITLTSTSEGIATGQLSTTQGLILVNSATDGDIGEIAASASASVTTDTDLIIGDVDAGSNGSINVGGNLTAGNLFAGTISPGLNVDVGGDANIESATTNGLLDLDIVGALSGGDFIGQGPGSIVTIDAASVDVSLVQSTNQNVTVAAPGAVSIGDLVANSSSTVTGSSVNLDNGTLAQGLAVTSTSGDITGLGSITVANTATFDAIGNIAIGTLEAGVISLTSGADLRFNGLISPAAITLSAAGVIGATTPGEGDIDSGGNVDLTAQAIDMGDITSTGAISADASVGDASFGALNAGTTIDITAQGSPLLESVTSGGNVTLSGASVDLDGGDVGGSLTLNALAGDITLAFDGTDQLVVAAGATFNAIGSMFVTHTNNTADTVSVDVGFGTLVDIGGSFVSEAGSILDSGIDLTMFASDSIEAADLRATEAIFLQAGGNVTLNNASVTGPQSVSNLRGIIIEAGFFDFGGSGLAFDNSANATITGTVTSYDDIDITAGGNAVFAGGSNTAADNALIVNTGDDIIVEAGAVLSSANDPTDPITPAAPFEGGPNLELIAGGETNLLSIPTSPIASLVIDGTLDANDASIILEGNAIEGLDSDLIAGFIKADVRDAPNTGSTLEDDNGLLSGPCLEGVICLGDMDAENVIEIGIDSNNDAIQLFIEQAQISATDISIQTRNDIVMGTNGIDTDLNATGTFSAESTTGNVDLRDASIGADQILITAAGSVLGTGVLTSGNDIGITVGDSIIVGGIDTGGELTTVADIGGGSGSFEVPGSFIAGFFNQGGSSIDLFAGGNINIGEASSPSDVILTANGDISLGFAGVGGAISLDGANIDYGLLDGSDVFVSGFGVVNGGDARGGSVDISGDLVNVGDIDAGTVASVSGGSIAVRDVTADEIDLSSGSDIFFDRLDSTNSIDLDASSGSIASNGGSADILSDGDVTLNAVDIAVGDVTSGGFVSANATGGDASFGLVDAQTDITIDAAGAPTLAGAISGQDTSITGSLVAIDLIDAGGNVDVTATSGGVSIVNTLAGGNITISSAGDIDVDHAEADGNFTATGSSTIRTGLNSIITGGDIVIDVADAADLGNSSAGGLVDVSALSIEFVSVVAGTTVDMIADTFVQGTTLTAGDTVDVVSGTAGGTGGGSGGPVAIGGNGEIDFGTLTAIEANLLAIGGPVTVADAIIDDLLTAEGTAIDITSSTSLTVEALANDGDVFVSAQDILEAVLANATNDVTLESVSSDLVVNDAQGSNVTLIAANTVQIAGIADAGTFLDIAAGGTFDAANGSAFAEAINVLSGDVVLGNDSIIGDASRTFSIDFQAFGSMVIGGVNDVINPYQIDNTELTRISSGGSLNFTAFPDVSGLAALITLDQLDMTAGDGSGSFNQNFGQSSTLGFTAAGDIEVLGNLSVSGALVDTAVSFDAANRVRIDTANGGIFILNANGAPTGDLSVVASDFIAVTDQALIDISGISLAEIDLRLGDSDGVDRPEGIIRADALAIQTTGSDVFVQNTALGTAFDDRRGIEVNSLSISNGGTTDQPIVINGVVSGETGIEAIAVTNISSTPAAASTINGCLIADPALCATGTTPPTSPPTTPPTTPPTSGQEPNSEIETRDLIEDGLVPPEVQPEGLLQGGLIDLTPDASFGDDPLIDDPVTGAGNEDFWVGEEEECADGEGCST